MKNISKINIVSVIFIIISLIFTKFIIGVIFGILIPLVCATQGYETEGGAKGVGISTTKAAIKATVLLLMADLVVTIIYYVDFF